MNHTQARTHGPRIQHTAGPRTTYSAAEYEQLERKLKATERAVAIILGDSEQHADVLEAMRYVWGRVRGEHQARRVAKVMSWLEKVDRRSADEGLDVHDAFQRHLYESTRKVGVAGVLMVLAYILEAEQ